jgi:hypothetical protein
VQALYAIWRCWETGGKLDHHGQFYSFTLMNEEFSPGPLGLGPVPVTIAAVGDYMLKVAGRHCDGARLTEMSRQRAWDKMAPLISDEVLGLFVAMGTYEEIPGEIERRFGGIVDTVTIDFPPDAETTLKRAVVDAVRRIPSAFEGFRKTGQG